MALSARTCDICKEPLQTDRYKVDVLHFYKVETTNIYGKRVRSQSTYALCDRCYKMLESVAMKAAVSLRKEEN